MPVDSGLNFVPFSSNDVFKRLSKLKSKSAAGPDGLPPVFLKHIAAEIASPLAFIFEQFFSGAFVPPVWKEAYIRPIFKGGSACDPANYRPISLTCVCSKIMESIINEHMLSYLLSHDLITKHQHGFLAKRSTCTQLLECFQDWVVGLSNKRAVDVVYIDFSRAFDSVVYSKLFIKLESYGFNHELLAWIKSFLVDRCQRVVIDGYFSDFCRVCSGVPQGTVLAPLFFLLFIIDIVDLLGPNSVCKLFADDVKLYSNFNLSNTYNSDNNPLVLTLSNLETWSRVWQMRVNISKCSVLHLGLHNPLFQYTFNDKPLPTSTSVKDLGITYNHKLQFDVYILKIVSRAFQMVNLIFRSFVSRNIQILVRAFTTYVRPILEYCTPIWSPYLLKDINKIESVQRYFTRRLFPDKHYSYAERLVLTNLDTLESRRIKSDVIMCFKIINNLVDIDPTNFFNFNSNPHNTRGHPLKLIKQIYTSNSLANSFVNRCVNCWNALPSSIVLSPTLSQFKTLINKFDFSPFCVGER